LATSEDASENGRMLFLLRIAAADRRLKHAGLNSKKVNPPKPLCHPYPPMRRLFSIAVVFLFFASLAGGHAILLTATPAMGQVVRGSDIEVNLRFNSRVDAKRSRITLVPPGGGPRKLNLSEQSSPDSLNSQIHGLESGPYTLQWQVLAVDGHISRGEVPFRVQLRP
jgi:methionine-rich copper-binding protein CopC